MNNGIMTYKLVEHLTPPYRNFKSIKQINLYSTKLTDYINHKLWLVLMRPKTTINIFKHEMHQQRAHFPGK